MPLSQADLEHVKRLCQGVLEAADRDIHESLLDWETVDEAYVVAEMFGIKLKEEPEDVTEER